MNSNDLFWPLKNPFWPQKVTYSKGVQHFFWISLVTTSFSTFFNIFFCLIKKCNEKCLKWKLSNPHSCPTSYYLTWWTSFPILRINLKILKPSIEIPMNIVSLLIVSIYRTYVTPYPYKSSLKFQNFSFEPKFAIFEGKSQKL